MINPTPLCACTPAAPHEPAARVEVRPATCPREAVAALPELTMRQLSYRVERLCRVFGLSEHDRSDLAGEATCEVLKALVRYDEALASKTTYAKGALDLWYAQKCKQFRRDAARASRRVPLPDPGSESCAFRDRHDASTSQSDLRLDMADRLSRLPGDLALLVRELQTKSIPQIAAERGVHRGTVHRLVVRLRAHFADLNPSMN